MSNRFMRDYWTGYRACKSRVFNCGASSAMVEYAYGLNGKSDAYCRGWGRHLEYLRDKEVVK